ncbi:MAG: TrkA family potassium uptake protein [Candidatus Bathyarchaeia archaeon]
MYIGIIGAGGVGAPLTRKFSQLGERVIVVDKNKERCKEIAETADAEIFVGDGKDPKLLDKAGIESVDVLLILTDDDEANAKICEVAKKQFGVPHVIVLANDLSMKPTLEKAGADEVICPEEEVIALFEKAALKRFAEIIFHEVVSNIKLFHVNINAESKAIGKSIPELGLPKGCRVFMILRGNVPIYPEERGKKIEIQLGDQVYLVGPSEQIDSAETLFY